LGDFGDIGTPRSSTELTISYPYDKYSNRNAERETRNTEHGTQNTERGTWNTEHGT